MKLGSDHERDDRPFDGAVVAFYPVRMYRGLREAALLRRGSGDGWRDGLSKVTELEVERDLQSAGACHRRRARDPEVEAERMQRPQLGGTPADIWAAAMADRYAALVIAAGD